MSTSSKNLDPLRHSTAHLLAAAVLKLYPDARPAIGPPIADGFYYDFDFGAEKINDQDLPKIQKEMRRILPDWRGFTRAEVSAHDAQKLFTDNPYKRELIAELEKSKETITLYSSGGFTDLCRGGHVENPARDIKPDAFALTHIAGAYWRGDEKNPMLTRIYGTVFPSKQELEEHLAMLAEAKKRDHKTLGPALGIFMFHETAPGMPYWLPNGMVILNALIDFWRKEHFAHGYQEISSPIVNKKELWETSGHWEHYRQDMFIAQISEHETYGIKAMNCPNAMIVFGSQLRSYRDLPLRLSDTDILHRYERSGVLNGLLRVRSFRQDDSHNFITEDQIEKEYDTILKIAERFYGIFGMQYRLRLGTRPEKYMGDTVLWDKAEKALKNILQKTGKEYETLEGDGAFYGPKIDIVMRDAIGRDWQMGTIQLDFQQPRRFGLSYIDQSGQKKTPVVIHRVIYGSLDRFIGILIEHYAGAFPVWLAPVQVHLLPIADRHEDKARGFLSELRNAGIRGELVSAGDTLNKRIRESELKKVPYIIAVGDRETKDALAVRQRGTKEQRTASLGELIAEIHSSRP